MKTNLSNIVRAGSACPLLTAAIALAIAFTLFACEEKSGSKTAADSPKPAEQTAPPPAPKEEAGGLVGTSGTFKDDRDGKSYKWVKIGKQAWMAENLNYATKDSQCYGEGKGIITRWKDTGENSGSGDIVAVNKTLSKAETQANCEKYGRLYVYNDTAACPSGWHLPSKEEWQTLVDFAGGEEVVVNKFKAKSGWNNYKGKTGNGTDEFGFAALPGGEYVAHGGSEDEKSGDGYENIGNSGRWWSSTTESGTGELGDWFTVHSFYARNDNLGGIVPGGESVVRSSIRCIKD